jgi:transcriptional regulator with XRE-family HTH domain
VRYYDSERHRRHWARNLYTARLARNLTQAELGRALGIDQQNISRWERARSAPRDDMKILLAKFFGVPVPELFPWVDDDANGDEGRAA